MSVVASHNTASADHPTECDQCNQTFGEFDQFSQGMQIVLKPCQLKKLDSGERVADRPELPLPGAALLCCVQAVG